MSSAKSVSCGTITGVNGLVITVRLTGERPAPTDILVIEEHEEIQLVWREFLDRETARYINITGVIGIAAGQRVKTTGQMLTAPAGSAILGRVFNALGEPIDGETMPAGVKQVPVFETVPPAQYRPTTSEILETGIKVIDFLAPFVKGRKIGIIGGAGVGKTVLTTELMRNISASKAAISFFVGIGERIREGHELYETLKQRELLESTVMFFGQMNENAGMRSLVGLTAAASAQSMRDTSKTDILFFVDNIYRYVQANNELSTMLAEIPSEGGYQPSLFSELHRFEERLNSSPHGSITSVQSIYIPADDLSDPAVVEISEQLDSVIVLSRKIFESGIFPAVDLLATRSSLLTPDFVGERHYLLVRRVQQVLERYQSLQSIIAIIGESELSLNDRTAYDKAKRLIQFFSQNMFVTEDLNGLKGQMFTREETLAGVEEILAS